MDASWSKRGMACGTRTVFAVLNAPAIAKFRHVKHVKHVKSVSTLGNQGSRFLCGSSCIPARPRSRVITKCIVMPRMLAWTPTSDLLATTVRNGRIEADLCN